MRARVRLRTESVKPVTRADRKQKSRAAWEVAPSLDDHEVQRVNAAMNEEQAHFLSNNKKNGMARWLVMLNPWYQHWYPILR